MIDGRKIFDQPIQNDMKTYKNTWKIVNDQGDDYVTGCLLNYNYFKKHYKMIAIYLSKQQALNADPQAIQQVNFIGNVSDNNNILISSFLKKQKKQFLSFSQETIKY